MLNKTFYKVSVIGFVLAVQISAFVNCSKISSSQSENVDSESNAVINFKAGFIAPTSSKGKAVRSIRRSTETQQNQTFVTLKEYRHKLLDRYFLTARIQDQNILENDPQVKNDWEVTGQKITVSEIELPGYSPLCRFYNANTKTHFYTANTVECEQIKAVSGFVYEGIEGYAVFKNPNQSCGDLVPVIRVFANSTDVQKRRHRYISDDSFLGSYINKGWSNEKLSFCAEVVVKPTVTTVYPVDFSTATTTAWSSGSNSGSSSNNQFCIPGSSATQGCPVFSGGTSIKRCNAAGTGYGQCRASCNSSEDIISGMTSQTPSCVKRPTCSAGKKQCAGAGFNLAQDEFSVDCGDDGYDYNRDTVNGAWNYLGYGIIQRKDNPSISGPVCCMNKDGSGLGCVTVAVSIVPGNIIPDETYSQNNPPAGPQSCSFNGQVIAHGGSVTAYQSNTSSTSCVSQVRVCNNGILSGSYSYSSCTVNNPAGPQSCSFNGQVIAHGGSVIAYLSNTSSTSCVSQTRICNNGNLSGNYQYLSCQLTSQNPPVEGVEDYSLCKGNISSTRPRKYFDQVTGLSGTLFQTGSKIDQNINCDGTLRVFKVTVTQDMINQQKKIAGVALGPGDQWMHHFILSRRPCDIAGAVAKSIDPYPVINLSRVTPGIYFLTAIQDGFFPAIQSSQYDSLVLQRPQGEGDSWFKVCDGRDCTYFGTDPNSNMCRDRVEWY